MKFSELEELFNDYDAAKSSPSRSCVHLGCDCGCGGDSYTIEEFEEEENNADQSIENMKAFCKKHNIEWDGID
jgi:hypothetical protein